MAKGFGNCIFRQRPKDCKFAVFTDPKRLDCAVSGWELIHCFDEHYGNPLAKDGGLRIIEEFIHRVIENDEV
jgi:hypothetical protein